MGALRLENGRLLRHFGLVSEPFHVAPRRRDFFPAAAAAPGMAALVDGDGGRARLITITGEHGTGRTSALRRLAGELRSGGWGVFTFEAATAPHPEHLSHEDILCAACRTFGLYEGLHGSVAEVAEAADATGACLDALRARALDEPGRSPIAIVIDDAGCLADSALVGVLQLIAPAHETTPAPGSTALGLVLGGTPALLERLAEVAPDLVRHMDGAANIADVRLRTLAGEDVAAYVEHCLAAAGGQGRELFDAGAIECLAEKSGGNLGEINALGAPAMIFAWQASRQSISADLIDGTGIGCTRSSLATGADGPATDVRSAMAGRPGAALKSVTARQQPSRHQRGWIALGLAGLVMAGLFGSVGGPFLASGLARARAMLSSSSASSAPVDKTSGRVAAESRPAAATAASPLAFTAVGEGGGQISTRVPELAPDSISGGAVEAIRPGDATPPALVERGEALLRGADAVSARRFFARAAESGSAAAAAAMAASYDPIYLAENAIRGVEADPEQAVSWYRIAIARGDGTAQDRLSALVDSSNHP